MNKFVLTIKFEFQSISKLSIKRQLVEFKQESINTQMAFGDLEAGHLFCKDNCGAF